MEEKQKRKKFSYAEKHSILEKTGYRCAHCGKSLDEHTLTIEHIFPVSKGGENNEFNLVALCEDCNFDKSNFTYSIGDYYNYIKKEYIDKYIASLYKYMTEKKPNKEKFLSFDSMTYTVLPMQSKKVLAKMPKNKLKKMDKLSIDRMSLKFTLSRAYPGDADEIYELLNKRLEKYHAVNLNETIYRDELNILGEIYDSEVLVLRKGKEVHGAFILKKIDSEQFNFVQLKNIEEETALRVKYIMTLAVVSRLAVDAFSDIMDTLYNQMLAKNAIPIYFNIFTANSFSDYDKIIKMPMNIFGTDGELQFAPLSLLREYEKQEYVNNYMHKKDGEYSEEDLDEFVTFQLNRDRSQETTFGYPEHIRELCDRLGIKLRDNDV